MSREQKFSFKDRESVDAIFNYIASLNKGIKNRQISLGNEGQLMDIQLPEEADMELKALVDEKSGCLSVTLTWDCHAD